MANVRIFAEELLVVGALCSLSVAGCAGGGMPTAPTASPGSVTAVPLRFTGSETVQAAEGLRKKPDNRFVTCFPPDGSFLQISIEAMGGVNEAVQYCHQVLNGKTGGVVKAPPPDVP